MTKSLFFTAILFAVLFSSCMHKPDDLHEGYYTAESADYDSHGWKEYLLIYVSEGRIITAEYGAFNRSGFSKAWDLDYMRIMNRLDGTYPNEFSRIYTNALIDSQEPDNIDILAGATHSHATFIILAEAAINNAKAGDKRVALVDYDTQSDGD